VKELLEFIARSLVDHPEEVRVEASEHGGTVELRLHVSPEDLGKVIGRQGRIARAIRTGLKASSFREGKSASVEIVS